MYNLLTVPPLTPERQTEFWSRVNRAPDGCWEWSGSVNSITPTDKRMNPKNGYGVFAVGGHVFNAHRVAASIGLEDFNSALFVLHKCDNKRCVRPSHLYMGDQKQNFTDAVSRKRNYLGSDESRQYQRQVTSGEGNPKARLTGAQVLEIRRRYIGRQGISQAELAKEYGVSQGQIGRIIRGENWRFEV